MAFLRALATEFCLAENMTWPFSSDQKDISWRAEPAMIYQNREKLATSLLVSVVVGRSLKSASKASMKPLPLMEAQPELVLLVTR